MLNKVMLIGRLGGDPELKHIPSGKAVCKFNIATSEKFTDNAGDVQERTEWHGITAWEWCAEICAEYLHKGSLVYVEGSLRREKYKTASGEAREHTRVNARTVRFLSPKKKAAGEGYYAGKESGTRGGGGLATEPPLPLNPPSGTPVSDEDIPF